MAGHEFLFQTGEWVGEGKISFSASPETIHFYTNWWISKRDDLGIRCQQKVEMLGGDETVNNNFLLFDLQEDKFNIELDNESIGNAKGLGVVDPKTIAWEFRGNEGVEGFEVYELQENGDYMLHAEYASPDQFRTIIDGRIWKRTVPKDDSRP